MASYESWEEWFRAEACRAKLRYVLVASGKIFGDRLQFAKLDRLPQPISSTITLRRWLNPALAPPHNSV